MEWPIVILIGLLGFADVDWGDRTPTQVCVGSGGVNIYINTGADGETGGPKIDQPPSVFPSASPPSLQSRRIYLSPRVRSGRYVL